MLPKKWSDHLPANVKELEPRSIKPVSDLNNRSDSIMPKVRLRPGTQKVNERLAGIVRAPLRHYTRHSIRAYS